MLAKSLSTDSSTSRVYGKLKSLRRIPKKEASKSTPVLTREPFDDVRIRQIRGTCNERTGFEQVPLVLVRRSHETAAHACTRPCVRVKKQFLLVGFSLQNEGSLGIGI